MNFPVWELGFGSGLLIAFVAVFHVFVSHFAIGGGFFIVLTEYYAVSRNDRGILDYLKKHTGFFALLTLVFGAITGVGIWWTIGLINPAATSALIRNFVWIWAIEWVFFFIEVAAAIVMYTTWDRIPQRDHFIVGWIYFFSAWMSLFFINGILTFMLTTGSWEPGGNVWNAFFNPTFLPSFFSRMAICIALAGVYALITGFFIKNRESRARMLRYAGIWAVVGIVLAIPSLSYYHKMLPLGPNEIFAGVMPTTFTATQVLILTGIVLLALALFPVVAPRRFPLAMGFVMLLFALGAFGASEFIRESVRKPYTIHEYMYGNSIRPEQYPEIDANGGLLASSIWVKNEPGASSIAKGEEVFRIGCRNCHALAGYKGLRGTLTGTDVQYVSDLVARLDILRGKMPPFPGNPDEQEFLAEYLYAQTDASARPQNGEEVYRKRCYPCHTLDREFRGIDERVKYHSFDSFLQRIPTLGTMQARMARWSGTQEEARMLADYLRPYLKAEPVLTEGGR